MHIISCGTLLRNQRPSWIEPTEYPSLRFQPADQTSFRHTASADQTVDGFSRIPGEDTDWGAALRDTDEGPQQLRF